MQEPARITENTSTILDQFLTNVPDLVEKVTVLSPLSTNDHCTISLTLKFKKQKSSTYKRHVWIYKHADFLV